LTIERNRQFFITRISPTINSFRGCLDQSIRLIAIFVLVFVSNAKSTSPAALLRIKKKNKYDLTKSMSYPEPSFLFIIYLDIGSSCATIGSKNNEII
jgi:hypothetical protein